MKQYLELAKDILTNGVRKGDRTGTGTISVFGRQLRFDLREGFPLLTTKKVHLKSVIVELLWFLQGSTDNKLLEAEDCKIWREWALTDVDLDQPAPKNHPKAKLWRKNKTEAFATNEDLAFKSWVQVADKYNVPHPTYRDIGYLVGDLGPIYGKQWRSWTCPDGTTIDQIKEVIELLNTKPDSRRMIVSAWNPADLPNESVSPQQNVLNGKMALAACHTLFQFYTAEISVNKLINYINEKGLSEEFNAATRHLRSNKPQVDFVSADEIGIAEKYHSLDFHGALRAFAKKKGIPTRYLDCQLYQRSADNFLGVPFNIASYALLTHMVAQVVGMVPRDFIHTFGDVHFYNNTIQQIELQLTRDTRPLPTMVINPDIKDIFDFKLEDFTLENYDPHAAIKATVSV